MRRLDLEFVSDMDGDLWLIPGSAESDAQLWTVFELRGGERTELRPSDEFLGIMGRTAPIAWYVNSVTGIEIVTPEDVEPTVIEHERFRMTRRYRGGEDGG